MSEKIAYPTSTAPTSMGWPRGTSQGREDSFAGRLDFINCQHPATGCQHQLFVSARDHFARLSRSVLLVRVFRHRDTAEDQANVTFWDDATR